MTVVVLVHNENWQDGEMVGGHQIVDTGGPDLLRQDFDDQGTITAERPLTAEETAAVKAAAAAAAADPQTMVEALVADYANRQDPANPPAWAAPVGTVGAYLPGAIVAHQGKTWRNDLTAVNVWEPGTQNAGWTDLSPPPSGPQPWVQPTGSTDAYGLGDQVTHNGSLWQSTVAANVWEPGVYGWADLAAAAETPTAARTPRRR
jgi:hypothetical protein